MKISDLPLPSEVKAILENEDKITSLFPPQAEAIKKGLLDGKNMLIAIPTASGKTLLAELAALQHILTKGGKILYLCPLRALAAEKYSDFQRFTPLGITIALTSGDYDAKDTHLDKYDVIISTNEKIDALLQHRQTLIREKITLVIVDEIHLLDDLSRGPTLETLLVKLRSLNPKIQLVGLSATVRNASDLAYWLEAELVESEWRPVPLKECVYYNSQLFCEVSKQSFPTTRGRELEDFVRETLGKNGQVLVFANSRKNAVSYAKKLKKVTCNYLSDDEKTILSNAAKKILKNQKDRISKVLSELIQEGVVFHHAGLNSEQRSLLESEYKKKHIKVITATPTLAAGVNLPAKRVIIPSLLRYSDRGLKEIKVIEYKQMAGRAGRPKYDTEGEVVVIANNDRNCERYMNKYILGEIEDIWSQLRSEVALRSAILSFVSGEFVDSNSRLLEMFDKTLYAYQNGVFSIETKVLDVLDYLEENELIKCDSSEIEQDSQESIDFQIGSTRFGKRVSQLYLDPVSAVIIKEGLKLPVQRNSVSIFGFLQLIAQTPDISRLSYRKRDEGFSKSVLEFRLRELLLKDELLDEWTSEPDFQGLFEPPLISKYWSDVQIERLYQQIKVASLILDWINEVSIEDLVTKYDLGLGDINRLVETTKWLIFSAGELSRLFYRESKIEVYSLLGRLLSSLEIRIIHGVKQDIFSLIHLKGIGRVRGRALYASGYKSLDDLKKASISDLIRVKGIGRELAESVLLQLKDGFPETVYESLSPNKGIEDAQNFLSESNKEKEIKKSDRSIKKIESFFS